MAGPVKMAPYVTMGKEFGEFHVLSTTGVKYAPHSSEQIMWPAWHYKLTHYGYSLLVLYVIGVFAASYHLGYGIWNFCIRWGITVSEQAQERVQKLSFGCFIFFTLVGWAALIGFLPNRQTRVEHAGNVTHHSIGDQRGDPANLHPGTKNVPENPRIGNAHGVDYGDTPSRHGFDRSPG